ncbi:MAG: GntR family transcriptional regulator [Terrimicrobiaceae bacterium]
MALEKTDTLGIINNSPRARAIRHIQEWITDGRLLAGSRLPSEMRLATKLNVSRTTVRLALEDLEKQGMIHSENRRRVVNGTMRPQKTFLSDAIALVMEPPAQHEFSEKMHNTWHINFIHAGAVHAVRMAGYDALTVHPKRIAGDMLQRLIMERPGGAIVLCGVVQDKSGEHIGRALREGNIPFVIYGDMGLAHDNPTFESEIDAVVSDHEAGSYALTKWLISQGRKRILRFWQLAVSGPSEVQPWLMQRNAGYERAMREGGIEPLPAVEIFDPGYHNFNNTEEDFKLQSRLMAGYLVEHLHGPNAIDAIMAPSDAIVGHLCAALRVHGKQPNRDVLLVGYDNMWDDMETRQWEPLGPVATVDKKNLAIGAELMALLKERMSGQLFEQGQRRLVTPELIMRPSAYPGSGTKSPVMKPVHIESAA